MTSPGDIPFKDALVKADAIIRDGGTVYQKFTCKHCGNRLTITTPNTFHRSGTCDRCGHLTLILRCGFIAIYNGSPNGAPKEPPNVS